MAGLMAEYINRKNNYAMKKKKKKKNKYATKKQRDAALKVAANVIGKSYTKMLRGTGKGAVGLAGKGAAKLAGDVWKEYVDKKKNNYAMKYKNNITTAGTGTPLEPFSEQQGEDVLIAAAGTDPGRTEEIQLEPLSVPGRIPGAPEETKPSSLSFEKKYPDGGVRMSYDYYLGENDEKIKHGKYSRNYSDGSVAAKGEFKDGKKVGVWEEYKDGKLVSTYEYSEEVDGRQKRINKVYYDEEGNPRDLDKEIADRDWRNRNNFWNAAGVSIDLAKLSDEELTEKIDGMLEDTPGKQALSGATKGWMDAQIDKLREERQIRIDAGRWGGGAVDEYIERIR